MTEPSTFAFLDEPPISRRLTSCDQVSIWFSICGYSMRRVTAPIGRSRSNSVRPRSKAIRIAVVGSTTPTPACPRMTEHGFAELVRESPVSMIHRDAVAASPRQNFAASSITIVPGMLAPPQIDGGRTDHGTDASGWRSSALYLHVDGLAASDIAGNGSVATKRMIMISMRTRNKENPQSLTDRIRQRYGVRFPA